MYKIKLKKPRRRKAERNGRLIVTAVCDAKRTIVSRKQKVVSSASELENGKRMLATQ